MEVLEGEPFTLEEDAFEPGSLIAVGGPARPTPSPSRAATPSRCCSVALAAVAAALAGGGCGLDEEPRNRCREVADCLGGRLCVGGVCVDPGGPASEADCRAGCSQLATLCGPPPENCVEACLTALTPGASIERSLSATRCSEVGSCQGPVEPTAELASPGQCVAVCSRLEALCGESELACGDACVDARTSATVAACAADASSCEAARACGPPFDGAEPE